jgi:L-threonylcarbamoyladenylate synthase
VINRWHLKQAVREIKQGHTIAYPTEAIYGLGCDPFNKQAVEHLLALKKRHWKKGLILIAHSFSPLEKLLLPLDTDLKNRVLSSWEYEVVTWLLPAKPGIPKWLCGQSNKLAVRVTSHPLAANLCELWDKPLISTSANLTGRPAAKTALQVRQTFAEKIDYIIPGNVGGRTRPSEIRDAIAGSIIRT